jgi:diguanylate cyclase (GGDEF)-like protein/PAS domain S-box-containing protein
MCDIAQTVLWRHHTLSAARRLGFIPARSAFLRICEIALACSVDPYAIEVILAALSRHVIVASNHQADAELVRTSLYNAGYDSFEVGWAGSASEAVEQVKNLSVAAVFLDISLQSVHDIEPFDALSMAAPRVPILIMCGTPDELPVRGTGAAAAGYLPKANWNSEAGRKMLRRTIPATMPGRASTSRNQWAEHTLNSIGDAVISTDLVGNISYLNHVAESMTGWSRSEAHGRPFTEIFQIIDATTRQPARNPLDWALLQDHVVGLERSSLLVRRDGTETEIEDSAAPIREFGGNVVGAVLVFRDVGQARALALRMAHMAQHDVLTGLPNRVLFDDRLTQAINICRRHDKKLAALFLDIDDFKLVNDTWGHSVGDALLQSAANRIVSCLRVTDTVSRRGGDEFVILLSELKDTDSALRVGRMLLASMGAPHAIGQHRIPVSCSIGIGIYPDHGETGDVLLHNADTAMYRAKKKHGPSYQLFVPFLENNKE